MVIAHWAYHSLFDPGNIVATAVLWVPVGWFSHRAWARFRKDHDELHAKVVDMHRHLNPDDPFTLGTRIPPQSDVQ